MHVFRADKIRKRCNVKMKKRKFTLKNHNRKKATNQGTTHNSRSNVLNCVFPFLINEGVNLIHLSEFSYMLTKLDSCFC